MSNSTPNTFVAVLSGESALHPTVSTYGALLDQSVVLVSNLSQAGQHPLEVVIGPSDLDGATAIDIDRVSVAAIDATSTDAQLLLLARPAVLRPAVAQRAREGSLLDDLVSADASAATSLANLRSRTAPTDSDDSDSAIVRAAALELSQPLSLIHI